MQAAFSSAATNLERALIKQLGLRTGAARQVILVRNKHQASIGYSRADTWHSNRQSPAHLVIEMLVEPDACCGHRAPCNSQADVSGSTCTTTPDMLAMTCQSHRTSSAEKCAELCRDRSFTYGGKHMLLCNLPKLGVLVIQKPTGAEENSLPGSQSSFTRDSPTALQHCIETKKRVVFT